MYPGQ